MIRDLAAGTDQTVAEVMEYAVAKDGSGLPTQCRRRRRRTTAHLSGRSADGSTKTLLAGQGNYKGFAFDAKATQLAFVSDRDDYASNASRFKLYHASITSNAAIELHVPSETRAGPTAVSENGRLEFSKDGARLFFGTAPPPHADPDEAPEPVKVDIWHYKDAEIQPMQKVRAGRRAQTELPRDVHLADKTFTQLATPDMPDVLTHDSGAVALGVIKRALQAAHFVGRQLRRLLPRHAGRRIAKEDSGEGELPAPRCRPAQLRPALRRARRQLVHGPDERRTEHQSHGKSSA